MKLKKIDLELQKNEEISFENKFQHIDKRIIVTSKILGLKILSVKITIINARTMIMHQQNFEC
jgi:hypothetical protein